MKCTILFVFLLHGAPCCNQRESNSTVCRNTAELSSERMGQLREKCNTEELKKLFDACLQRTLPLLKVLNLAQKDDTIWLELIEAFEALIPRFDDVGLSEVSSILEKRSKMLQNEVVLFMKYLKNPFFVIDFDLIKGWLSLMKVDNEFKKHDASVQFSSNAPTVLTNNFFFNLPVCGKSQ